MPKRDPGYWLTVTSAEETATHVIVSNSSCNGIERQRMFAACRLFCCWKATQISGVAANRKLKARQVRDQVGVNGRGVGGKPRKIVSHMW
jgi:hypothetical protein